MSNKNLLNENTVRRFMKLAEIEPLTDQFVGKINEGEQMRKDDEDRKDDALEEGMGMRKDDDVDEGMRKDDDLEEGMGMRKDDALDENFDFLDEELDDFLDEMQRNGEEGVIKMQYLLYLIENKDEFIYN